MFSDIWEKKIDAAYKEGIKKGVASERERIMVLLMKRGYNGAAKWVKNSSEAVNLLEGKE